MPGNPLTKITKNLETAGWPYDPAAAANARWGMIPTTPAPKAVFDAQNNQPASGSFGFVKFNSGGSEISPIPNEGGLLGVKKGYGPKTMFQNSGTNEINYEILTPQPHVWELFTIYQPVNYHFDRVMYFEIDPVVDSIATWQVGDALQTSNGKTGVIQAFDGTNTVGLTDFTGHPELDWGAGDAITNTTRSETVTSTKGAFKGANAKLMALWVSDDETLQDRGYSNGNYSLGVDQDFDTSNPDFSGNGYAKIDGSRTDDGLPTQSGPFGASANEMAGGVNAPIVFDVADNGTIIHLCVERKRSSGHQINDGVFRLWKKTERAGSDYPTWTLLYENTDLHLYSSYNNNRWTHGYLFGNKNGGYREQTDFYMTRYELWTQKPTFLVDAGV